MADATAARRATAILRCLAAASGPLPAAGIARSLDLPRSSVYHLLAALEEDGFVVRYADDRRWGLGVAAFEVGTAYLRTDPLQRLARPILANLVRRLPAEIHGVTHCSVLHGRESLYIATQASTRGAAIVADVGVRLPASLTASGRSMLALLSASQVRALFPDPQAFVDRTGHGPLTPTGLTRLLSAERRAGVSLEEGMVVAGFSSMAVASVDRSGRPAAAVGITIREEHLTPRSIGLLTPLLRRSADDLSHQIGGTPGEPKP